MYIRDSIPVRTLDVKVPDGLECLWLLVTPAFLPREISSLLIAAVYHPPKAPNERQLMDHIAHTVASVKTRFPHCGVMICGDFNRAKITSLCSKGMKQVVQSPTRGQAVLDLIITDVFKFYKNTAMLPPIGKSDHNSILWEPDTAHKIKPNTVSVISRPMPDSAIQRFGHWISAYSWRPVLDLSCAQAKTTAFYDIIHEQVDKHFPTRRSKRCSNDKPWVTDKVRSLIRKRQDAYKKGKEALWKTLRNSVNRAVIQAKQSFTGRRLPRANTINPRPWFSAIKQIGGLENKPSRICLPGHEQSSAASLADAVNAHFATICSTLPALDTARLPAYLPAATRLPAVTRCQIWKELSHISVHKAPGPDNLPNRLLKEFAFELSDPVCSIINASLQQGVVPEQWKRATIVPVPKINPPPSMDKLRPISLTPTLAKVAEGIAGQWMMEDMTPQLDPRQYGNRKGRSTTHYLVQLVQFAFQALEDNHCTDLLAIDYSKAFDRVDVTVALHKLLHMGVRRELLPWIGDFLSNRKQQVKMNGVSSDWRDVTCGVPQGTKIGPIVFLAMVNDVAQGHNDRWKFVDDITVAARSKPTVSTNPVLQHTMEAISADADNDHMLINIAKCCTMRITATKGPDLSPILVNQTEVPHRQDMQLLGVTIQHNLKWDTQVQTMIMKANTRRYFLTVLKRAGVQLQDLVRCYSAFIRPMLEYASPVWHPGLTKELSDDLEQVQRQCLRTLLPELCYREALQRAGLQTLAERRLQLCLNFARGLAASDFSSWLPSHRGQCHQRTLRNNHKLNVLSSRTKRFNRSPIANIVSLLNSTN